MVIKIICSSTVQLPAANKHLPMTHHPTQRNKRRRILRMRGPPLFYLFGQIRAFEWLALRDIAQSQPLITSAPALADAHSAGVQNLDAKSRVFRCRCRCRCRDGKSASRRAYLHGFRAVFLLSSGSIVFPAMSREHETRRVRKPLLSSPGSKLLRRFRSRSPMKSVSIDTSCI